MLLMLLEKYKKSNIAQYKLCVIYEAINNGWKPDHTEFQ